MQWFYAEKEIVIITIFFNHLKIMTVTHIYGRDNNMSIAFDVIVSVTTACLKYLLSSNVPK